MVPTSDTPKQEKNKWPVFQQCFCKLHNFMNTINIHFLGCLFSKKQQYKFVCEAHPQTKRVHMACYCITEEAMVMMQGSRTLVLVWKASLMSLDKSQPL